MSRQSRKNSEDPQNSQPRGDEHPAVREGYNWYWKQDALQKPSGLMLDSYLREGLLNQDLLDCCWPSFYDGWSRAQQEHRRLKRLRRPGSPTRFPPPGAPAREVVGAWKPSPRRSQILWNEEKNELTLLLPRLKGPLEIRLPGNVWNASPAERAVTIAIAELTIGADCVETFLYPSYLHMMTGLPTLEATRRALRGALQKGCIRMNPDYSEVYLLANAHEHAEALGLLPGARCF